MKYLTAAIVLALFMQAVPAQPPPAVPLHSYRWGPLTPDTPKEAAGAGVYHGHKRVLQIVHGRKYYQPYDFLLPTRPYNGAVWPKDRVWHVSRINWWSDGKEWVDTWQFQGETHWEYNLTFWHGKMPAMTEPPWPE